jgi:hypothetical protein
MRRSKCRKTEIHKQFLKVLYVFPGVVVSHDFGIGGGQLIVSCIRVLAKMTVPPSIITILVID